MKILLTGKNGQVGFELQQSLAALGEVIAVDLPDCDLAKPEAVRKLIRSLKPDIIVNPAAYTAVDKAESEPELAYTVNGTAPGIIGEEARRINATVIHYSTDYVFDGKKPSPYLETDVPNPLNVYGKSKLLGEEALVASGTGYLILRTSWVFGAHGNNFIKTILRLAAEKESLNIIADQLGAPTSAKLIAKVTGQIIRQQLSDSKEIQPTGLFHLTAAGATTWYEYAQYIVKAAMAAGKTLRLTPEAIKPIPTSAYPVPAVRPANSRLDTSKLRREFGLQIPGWQEGLDEVLAQIL